MEWTRDKCIELIQEYERNPLLWNSAHGLYYNRTKKQGTWAIIDKKLGCSRGDAKKKIDSILSSFRREKSKGKKSIGAGRDETYVSKWYAFPHLAFLLDKDEPSSTIDSIEEEILPDDEYENTFKEEEEEEEEEEDEEETDATYLQNTELKTESLQNTELRTEVPQTSVASKKRKRIPLQSAEDPKIGEAFKILKGAVTSNSLNSDECSVYGQHVANKLRSYNKKAINIVQHHINMILFNADMGQYDDGETTTVSTPSP